MGKSLTSGKMLSVAVRKRPERPEGVCGVSQCHPVGQGGMRQGTPARVPGGCSLTPHQQDTGENGKGKNWKTPGLG